MIKIFLILLSLVVINSSLSILLKKKFGLLMPFTLISLVLMFYLCGYIKTLSIGIYLFYLLTLLSLIYLIVSIIKNKYKEYVVTPGLFVFIGICIFVVILNYDRQFSLIDEWSHWGLMAEETFRLRRLHLYTESTVWLHKEYPPFFTLLEAMFNLLVGTFKDSHCYQILQIFSLSLFLPVFDLIKRKKVIYLVIFVLILFVPNIIVSTEELTYPTLFYNCIYPDWSISFYLAFCIVFVVLNDFNSITDFILITIALSGLIITKEISAALCLLVIAVLLFKLIISISNKKKLLRIIPVILAPVLVYVSWSILCNKYNVTSHFSFKNFDLLAIFKYFTGSLPEYESGIFKSFIDAFISRPLLMHPFKMSYLLVLLTISISIGLISLVKKEKRKEFIGLGIFTFIGGLGYAYSLCLSYAYTFTAPESTSLVMFNRYMLLYIVAAMIIMFYLVLIYVKDNIYKYIGLTVILVLFTNYETIKYNYRIEDYNKKINDIDISPILENTSTEDRIIILNHYDIEKTCFYRYKLIINTRNVVAVNIPCRKENSGSVCDVSEKQFLDMLSDYDVVVVSDYDDSFVPLWQSITDIPIPYNDTGYRIKRDSNNKIYLEMIS